MRDAMSSSAAIHIVGPAQFDRATAQTPGSERRAAITPALGIASAIWGGLFEVESGSRTGIHHHGEQECSAEPNTPGTVEVTRRTVIETGSTALLLTTLPRAALAAGPVDDNEPPTPAVDVELQINGHPHSLTLDPRTTLLDALREHLPLASSTNGRDHGQCGACTGLIEGHRINSCLTLPAIHTGHSFTTTTRP